MLWYVYKADNRNIVYAYTVRLFLEFRNIFAQLFNRNHVPSRMSRIFHAF